MEDLERQLIKVQREMRGRELTRRFIVTEAMFEDGGDIVDLAAIVRILLTIPRPTSVLISSIYVLSSLLKCLRFFLQSMVYID